ncbi:segment polarity protein dishevelled homolog DVL-3-like isoform X2 [Oscarella lobularis]|uniref:segment polarity protein dishevelled homolog DVL-3-like isoform X2 n=1 Tax=Oscarella lobularis TaxID=121494 RepID=UPI00331341E1
MVEEVKVIYHIDEEETPYLVKLPKPPDQVTLKDLKVALNRPNYKFFFKSMDEEVGVVKEEVSSDDAPLPYVNGRVVAWLVCGDSSSEKAHSETGSEKERRTPNNAESRSHDESDGSRGRHSSRKSERRDRDRESRRRYEQGSVYTDESASVYTTDTDPSLYSESTDDGSSVYTTDTYSTSRTGHSHRRHKKHHHHRHHSRHNMHRAPSYSSVSSSTMSMPIVTVTLSLEKTKFLGISIVGQANRSGDGGIYVGSVMKGGAVAEDGTIQPGDMILQVNEASFENLTNDEAVKILREAVHQPVPLKLVVAKCWDPEPQPYFEPRSEPIKALDPAAWVQHTQLARRESLNRKKSWGHCTNDFFSEELLMRHPGSSPTMSSMTSSSSMGSSLPESDRGLEFTGPRIPEKTPPEVIIQKMAMPDSGLDIRNRVWLKMTIPNAFTGSDFVDWLYKRVEGFKERRDARKYAGHMLKLGLIKHTVNKITFSEQCYYIFGNITINPDLANLRLNEEGETDTLGPLPGGTGAPWMAPPPAPLGQMPPPGRYQLPQYLAAFSGGDPARTYSQTTGSGSGSSPSQSEYKKKYVPSDARSYLTESDQASQYSTDTMTETASIASSQLVIPRRFQRGASVASSRRSVREGGGGGGGAGGDAQCEDLFVDVM